MRKLIKILFNISYIVSLSALVFLGSVISKVTDKKGQNNKDGVTILGSNLSLNHASADLPDNGGGDSSGGSGSDGCGGDGGGGC